LLPARAPLSPRTHWRNPRRVRRRASGRTVAYNLRFPGQVFDGEAGLHQNGFRDFDPATGRYAESDPIGLRGLSYSTYTYAGDNPNSYVDLFGLTQTCPTCKQSYLDCLANCIRKYDPLNTDGKSALTTLGAPIPKSWFGLPVQGSPFTTLPSVFGLGGGTAASGVNLLRVLGRVSNVGFILYGDYLAAMELVCAGRCIGDHCAF